MARFLPALMAACAALVLTAGPAAAAGFDVPEGFVSERVPEMDGEAGWRDVLVVHPVDGLFAELSSVRLVELAEHVDDADAWLKSRLSGDFGDFGDPEGAEGLFASPDSPFADPAFDALRDALPKLLAGLRSLAELPLNFCDDPTTGYNASGAFRELHCVFAVGPVRQFLVLRLQEAGGRWFHTEIRTMNERRLRHFTAIANSFRLEQ